MLEQFKKEVIEGLSKIAQKTLPSKYFYDKKGDELFVKITRLPEYYLTRAEMETFQEKTSDIIAALHLDQGKKYSIVELGAGDGTKTIHLLRALINRNYDFEYLPVDISKDALDGIKTFLNAELPTLVVKPNHNDYFKALENLKQDGTIKIILFLGSNIGNLIDEQATEFIYQLGSSLAKGDKIILGVDLKKAKEIILPAYNDNQGITAEFNLNLLDRINKELSSNFIRANFIHAPFYDEEVGIAKSYIKSLVKQSVTLEEHQFNFEKDELIHTEVSRKYDDQVVKQILSKTDITWEHKITDKNNLFADYILQRN
ncbi:L-histidine N(alpha)-methyltransferase [Flavobacterium sp.]|jgi:dimethylhistidine N-methyltransferase|uniref:L-histidine N(alpha)-methyltransferase n=1 Tax=Flavobacterium sp. TaxID=239 RepID=UPI0025C65DC4|nr:L-histidine N(alpha)-methyltransferase [Flavobacterium sp.]MBA4155381.1 L-histidine N(alpha)-methyltransferase [Flavobacterium sp.]